MEQSPPADPSPSAAAAAPPPDRVDVDRVVPMDNDAAPPSEVPVELWARIIGASLTFWERRVAARACREWRALVRGIEVRRRGRPPLSAPPLCQCLAAGTTTSPATFFFFDPTLPLRAVASTRAPRCDRRLRSDRSTRPRRPKEDQSQRGAGLFCRDIRRVPLE
jgi:hypothetical protein